MTADGFMQPERVWRKFIIFVKFALKINCPPYNYLSILRRDLNLDFLANHQHVLNCPFLRKLFSGFIHFSSLLNNINFKVPVQCIRNSPQLFIPHYSAIYLQKYISRSRWGSPMRADHFHFLISYFSSFFLNLNSNLSFFCNFIVKLNNVLFLFLVV